MSVKTTGSIKTYKSAADYSDKQYYIVWLSGETATLADDADVAGENLMGVIQNKPASATGANVEVHMPWGGGSAKVIAGGTIAVGDHLTTDANGKAVATTTSGDYVFGVAMQTAVAGDIFEYCPVYDIVD